jgi:hypothetical protein
VRLRSRSTGTDPLASKIKPCSSQRCEAKSGEEEIRTPDTVARIRDFQSRSFSRSDTSPETGVGPGGQRLHAPRSTQGADDRHQDPHLARRKGWPSFGKIAIQPSLDCLWAKSSPQSQPITPAISEPQTEHEPAHDGAPSCARVESTKARFARSHLARQDQ